MFFPPFALETPLQTTDRGDQGGLIVYPNSENTRQVGFLCSDSWQPMSSSRFN